MVIYRVYCRVECNILAETLFWEKVQDCWRWNVSVSLSLKKERKIREIE